MKSSNCISCLSIICVFLRVINSEALQNVTVVDVIPMFDEVYKQLDILTSGNDIQKLRMQIMGHNMDEQLAYFTKIESKLQGIEEYMAKLDRTMVALLNGELKYVMVNANTDNQDRYKQSTCNNMQDTGNHPGGTNSNKEGMIPHAKNVGNLLLHSHGDVAIDDHLSPAQDLNITMERLEDFGSMRIEEEHNCSAETQWQPIETGQEIMDQTDETGKPLICVRKADQKLVCSNTTLPTSCAKSNSLNCFNHKCRIENRLYGRASFLVPCDDTTGGGGWTVIQRRISDSIDFSRNWTEYKEGFGDLDGNFWIGLEKLYALTTTLAPVELLIQLKDYDDVLKYAKYDSFRIDDESTQYVIRDVGAYSGTARDSFSQHNGHKFSTPDRDNDSTDKTHCSSKHKSGWWYLDCYYCNLNGFYFKKGEKPIKSGPSGINWGKFHGFEYSLKFAQMSIRPKNIQ